MDETFERYTDWKSFYLYRTTSEFNQQVGPVNPTAKSPTTTVDEIHAVIFDVEGGEIVRYFTIIIITMIYDTW